MDQRAQYLIQILEKIGSPLMHSVLQNLPASNQANLHAEAQKIAELLGRTVQTSIELGRIIDISKLGERGDSMRVALAAVAAPLIASIYRRNGAAPDEAALKRMTGALESVLSFSENFAPDEDNITRLQELRAEGRPTDHYQVYVQYMQAFIPVLDAISSFTFGQNESKLVMDVSSRLSAKASDIRQSLFGKVDPHLEKFVDLSILRVLADLYSACHMAETRRISGLSDEERTEMGQMSLAPVWALFDERIALLEALSRSIVPESATQSSGAQGVLPSVSAPQAPPQISSPPQPPPITPAQSPPPPKAPPAVSSTPVQTAPAQAPVSQPAIQTQTPLQPAQAPLPEGLPASSGQNPMAMFAKKPAAPETAKPPAPSTPPAPPTATPQEGAAKTNPMAFFRPDTQNDDE